MGHVSPKRGPAGTRFHFWGRCFIPNPDTYSYGVFLNGYAKTPAPCDLIAGGRFHITVNKRLRGHGWIEPDPDGGQCFQEPYKH
jgi:hypothetical protein